MQILQLIPLIVSVSYPLSPFPVHPIKFNRPIMHSMRTHNTNRHQIRRKPHQWWLLFIHQSKLNAFAFPPPICPFFPPAANFYSSTALNQVQSHKSVCPLLGTFCEAGWIKTVLQRRMFTVKTRMRKFNSDIRRGHDRVGGVNLRHNPFTALCSWLSVRF